MKSFSVVTISYNQAAFLERCIRSVIEQQGVEVQYVLVDPGSTDGSREIVKRWRDRINIVVLEPDHGPADGLNNGLAVCTGEYFAFINADDALEPGALSEAAALFERWPDIDVVCGDSWRVDEHDRILRRLVSPRRFTARLSAQQVSYVVQQSAFFRTQQVRDAGGFDIGNRTCWDGELCYRLAKRGARFRRVNRVWARFRVYGGSITGSGRLFELFRRDADTIFAREFGRFPRQADRVISRLVRWRELLRDPRSIYWKVANRLGLVCACNVVPSFDGEQNAAG